MELGCDRRAGPVLQHDPGADVTYLEKQTVRHVASMSIDLRESILDADVPGVASLPVMLTHQENVQ